MVKLLLLFALVSLAACSTPEEKKEKHYLRAMEYIKIADDKAAILELKNAIQLDAKFAEARYQLGLLFLKSSDPQAAFAELQRAFSLDPGNADAGVKVAEFLLLAKNNEESRSYVQRVLDTHPDYPEAVALLANLELMGGNFTKAEEYIDKAIGISPDNDKFHSIRGRILAADNRWPEGEQAFRRAIELNPQSFAHYRTLLMYSEQRGNEAAIGQLLDTMTQKFPGDPQLHLLYAGLYQKNGEWDKAEQAFLKAIAIKPENVSFRLLLVDFYKARRQNDKAEEYLRKTLTELQNDIQLQAALAELQFDTDKFEEARNLTEAILKTNPANGAAGLLKARFLIKEGKNEEAGEILIRLTADYPKWGEPFYYAALAHLRRGELELAQKSIETAIRNTPGNDRAHTLAAQVNLLRGQGAEAGREAAAALRINQRNFAAAKIMIQALVLQKDFARASQLVKAIDDKIVAQDADLLGAAGIASLGQDDKQAAAAAFTQLLKIAPGNTKALSMLVALTAGKDPDQAIALVKKHLAAHEAAGHYLLLGDLYLKNRQNELALQSFEKAQELNPADPQGYMYRARLLQQLGKADESIAQYNELLASQPQSIPALMGLATTLDSQGKTAEAMAAYKKVLECNPDFPAAANNLAWLIVSQEGDLGEALRLAMQAKQALPDQPNIADTLGWVHYKRQSYNLAISQFSHALKGRPDDPTFGFHLALARYANGEKTEAIALLQEVVAGDKNFSERDEAQATLEKWQSL